MAIVAVNIVPLGVGSSESKYVAAAEKVIQDKPGIKSQLGPMLLQPWRQKLLLLILS